VTDTCTVCKTVIEFPSNAQKPKVCPNCESKYWSKPTGERSLFCEQDRFIESGRNPSMLSELYLQLRVYSGNCLKHLMRIRKNLPENVMEEKTDELTLQVIEKYLSLPTFTIKHSFGGYIRQLAKGVLFGNRRDDESISFDSLVNWEDTSTDAETNHVEQEYVLFFIRYIHTLSHEESQKRFLYLLGMKHHFSHRYRSFLSQFSSRYLSREQRVMIDITKRIIQSFLTTGEIQPMNVLPLTLSRQEIFEDQIFDIFQQTRDGKSNPLIEVLRLLLHSSRDKSIIDLFYLLGIEKAMSVISLFENRTVTFPSQDSLREDILTAVLYYYREIENKSWGEIKQIVPIHFSSISYASKIKKVNSQVIDMIRSVLGGDQYGTD